MFRRSIIPVNKIEGGYLAAPVFVAGGGRIGENFAAGEQLAGVTGAQSCRNVSRQLAQAAGPTGSAASISGFVAAVLSQVFAKALNKLGNVGCGRIINSYRVARIAARIGAACQDRRRGAPPFAAAAAPYAGRACERHDFRIFTARIGARSAPRALNAVKAFRNERKLPIAGSGSGVRVAQAREFTASKRGRNGVRGVMNVLRHAAIPFLESGRG